MSYRGLDPTRNLGAPTATYREALLRRNEGLYTCSLVTMSRGLAKPQPLVASIPRGKTGLKYPPLPTRCRGPHLTTWAATEFTLRFDPSKTYRAPIGDMLASEEEERKGTLRHTGFAVLRQEMAVLHRQLSRKLGENTSPLLQSCRGKGGTQSGDHVRI